MNDIDYCISISNTKDEYIKNMNKLNYQVVWTDTRKYITYITKDGNKCRDKSLHDPKYLKEAMEDEFRSIKREKPNYTGKQCNATNNTNGILYDTTRDTERFIRVESYYKGKYNRYTRKTFKGQCENERRNAKNSRTEDRKSIPLSETRFTGNGRRTEKQNFQNKMENGVSNILGGVIAISNMVSNTQINNRPRRNIRRYRTLSKQAMKEYAIKKANSSGFDWFEDEEMEQ